MCVESGARTVGDRDESTRRCVYVFFTVLAPLIHSRHDSQQSQTYTVRARQRVMPRTQTTWPRRCARRLALDVRGAARGGAARLDAERREPCPRRKAAAAARCVSTCLREGARREWRSARRPCDGMRWPPPHWVGGSRGSLSGPQPFTAAHVRLSVHARCLCARIMAL